MTTRNPLPEVTWELTVLSDRFVVDGEAQSVGAKVVWTGSEPQVRTWVKSGHVTAKAGKKPAKRRTGGSKGKSEGKG